MFKLCFFFDRTNIWQVCRHIGKTLRLGGGAAVFSTSFDRPNIHLEVRYSDAMKSPMDDLLRFLDLKRGEGGIIFCRKRGR